MVQDDPESPERTSGSHDDEPRSRAASRAGAGLHRRQLLTAGGLLLTSCTAGTRAERVHPARLDQLFEAHAEVLPEAVGAGANHYPMAAEALEALGYEAAIDESWIAGAALYSGELGRVRPLVDEAQRVAALGDYARFGDWLDYFREALRHGPWSPVVARWAPRLAPAICAAAFHGVIRTGHATRALRARDTLARRNELAVGLAYWASRYVELPTTASEERPRQSLSRTLAGLTYPWLDDAGDVGFSEVVPRLTALPLAPPVTLEATGDTPRAELDELVREAATALLEMLVLERHRIWLLHTVTGPAAVQWLLPEVDANGARCLVEYARQGVVAMYRAFGEPYTPGAHLRASPAAWPAQVRRTVDSRSVHGIKLIDALLRFERADDPLCRSVAAQWSEWT